MVKPTTRSQKWTLSSAGHGDCRPVRQKTQHYVIDRAEHNEAHKSISAKMGMSDRVLGEVVK